MGDLPSFSVTTLLLFFSLLNIGRIAWYNDVRVIHAKGRCLRDSSKLGQQVNGGTLSVNHFCIIPLCSSYKLAHPTPNFGPMIRRGWKVLPSSNNESTQQGNKHRMHQWHTIQQLLVQPMRMEWM